MVADYTEQVYHEDHKFRWAWIRQKHQKIATKYDRLTSTAMSARYDAFPADFSAQEIHYRVYKQCVKTLLYWAEEQMGADGRLAVSSFDLDVQYAKSESPAS